MGNGYAGRILRVNLNRGTVRTQRIDEGVAREYFGGKGYATRILYQYLSDYERGGVSIKDMDALDPKNVLVFMTGPGTGVTRFPSPGRHHVMALKSPLTGSIGSANSGGEWGPFLKFAGFDGIVVEGAARTPVYLSVVDGKAKLNDATELWGSNVFDTTAGLFGRVCRGAM